MLRAISLLRDKKIKLESQVEFLIRLEINILRWFRNSILDVVEFDLRAIPNEEVAIYFNRADIVVFPYKHIYQSGALLLAYSFGKPVIVSKAEGFKEDIENGTNGFIVNVEDAGEFSNAILKMMRNKVAIKEMGQTNKKLAKLNIVGVQ